jgi:hypothetical protein
MKVTDSEESKASAQEIYKRNLACFTKVVALPINKIEILYVTWELHSH